MEPPKDSRDPNWRGPLKKGALKIEHYYFFECLEAATCQLDIDTMTSSPEWSDFYLQAVHDFPWLLRDEEGSLINYLEEKKAEFVCE